MERYSFVMVMIFLSAFGWPLQAAQPGGHAEISRPAAGDTVSDVVTILGSASSPNFGHYELSFAYDPNPTDTWFPIGEPVSTQVSFGRLGLWDTSRITDGTYALRLTVTLKDGSVLEDIVSGIGVRSSASGRSSSVLATALPSVEPGIGGPSAGPAAPNAELAAATAAPGSRANTKGRGIAVGGVVLAGAGASVLGLLGLGAYVQLRRTMRQRWGTIRSRRLHSGSRAEGDREGGRE